MTKIKFHVRRKKERERVHQESNRFPDQIYVSPSNPLFSSSSSSSKYERYFLERFNDIWDKGSVKIF
jgi:hypothetical protein